MATIQLLTDDPNQDLQNKLQTTGFFSKVESVQSTENLDADIIYLAESVVTVNDLPSIRAKHTDAVIFFQIKKTKDLQHMKQINQVLQSVQAHLILPHLSASEVVDRIVQLFIEDEDRNPIVLFAGILSGIGTTSVVHAVAKRIHQLSDIKIGVLGLDEWDPGTTLITYKGRYLDQIKILLSSRDLTPDQLISSMDNYGYYYLAGNPRIRLQKQYTSDEISYLIQTAKSAFDLVLIDGGSHFDNACMLESIKASSRRFLVTTQSRKGVTRYIKYSDEFVFSQFSLLINQYRDIPELPSSRMVAEEYQMPLIASIPDLENIGFIAELQKQNLLDFEDREYVHAIDMIARGIIRAFDFNLRDVAAEEPKKRKFLRFGG